MNTGTLIQHQCYPGFLFNVYVVIMVMMMMNNRRKNDAEGNIFKELERGRYNLRTVLRNSK